MKNSLESDSVANLRPVQAGDHVYLIDGSTFIFRAYFAMFKAAQARGRSFTRSDGTPVGAVMAFCNMLWKIVREGIDGADARPTHLAVVFDPKGGTFRNEIYPEYKANRSPAPEELKRQFQWCRQWVRALGISEVASDRHEADDLIGSLATFHRNEQTRIVILTADKDLAQLIRENDIWWSYATGQQLNYRSLIKRFGVKPEQIADQLAIAGDKVDNIPGIPGVGMTLAGRLLTKFGDIANLRNNLDEVKKMKFRGAERIMGLLKQHEAILDISAQLTSIYCDIKEMKQLQTETSAADLGVIQSMMDYHQMGERRQQQWLDLIETRK
ncbi:MAG: 5'-3' exonuclease H3TH domain-containing protein [Alphaproteobacteria bacterium]